MVVDKIGTIRYYDDNGQLHREVEPAVEYTNGTKLWFQYGKCHRVEGPALIYPDGRSYWFYKGRQVECETKEEFDRLVRLISFW